LQRLADQAGRQWSHGGELHHEYDRENLDERENRDNGRRFLNPPAVSCSELFAGSIAVATAATVSASAAATMTAPATPAAGALFSRPGDVNGQSAATQVFAIHGAYGFLSLLGRTHRHKAETPRASSGPVCGHIGFDDRAVRGKGVLQVVFRDFEVEVPDE
jgi:hypothetical protein